MNSVTHCEYAVDKVGKGVVPLFLQFSELGIVPKVVGKEGKEHLKMEMVRGVSLGSILLYTANRDKHDEEIYARICNEYGLLGENTKPENIISVYRQLGSNVALIKNCGVVHNDLHPGNVIVEGKERPYIIDWGESYIEGEQESEPSYKGDKDNFLVWTKEFLLGNRIDNFANMLEKAFCESFEKAVATALRKA